MKFALKLGYVLAAVAMLSCSDDVTNASRMRIVESLGADGSCLEGELALNMADSAVYVCIGDGQWVSMSGETGEKGDKGNKGETGKKGADGTSCTASPVANGVEIYCDGQLITTIFNGQDGANGQSCTLASVVVNGLDGVEITCGAQKDTVMNGAQGIQGVQGEPGAPGATGAAGASCSGVSLGGNAILISCGGVVVDTLYNGAQGEQGIQGVKGEDGSSCTGRSIAGVGIEISCGEVVVDTLRNGQDGAAGESCTGRNLDGIGIEISCGGTVIDTLPGYMISSSSSLSSSSSSLSSSSTGLPTDGSCLLADCAASMQNGHWVAGDHCSYGGHNYTSRGWASEPPGGIDDWAWVDEGPCTYAPGQSSYSSSSSSFPSSSSSSSSSSSLYLPPDGSCLDSNCVTITQDGYWRAGTQCSYNGHNWHAKWFATELPPDAAWADDGACGIPGSSSILSSSSSGTTCVAAVCVAGQAGGQYCAYDNHNWHSQWYTVTLPPSDGWVDDGECGVSSSSSLLSSSSSSAGHACVAYSPNLFYDSTSIAWVDGPDYVGYPGTTGTAYRCKTGMGIYCYSFNPTSSGYGAGEAGAAWDIVGECD